ncbi:MAG: CPBP family glutamic-type intramembrane protease, partial [Candidatus Bathyarchaeia archaeon]
MKYRPGLSALLTFIGVLALITFVDGLLIGFQTSFKGLSLEEAATEVGKPMLILNELILLMTALLFIKRVLKTDMKEVGLSLKGLKVSDLRLGLFTGVGGWIISVVASATLARFFPVEVPEWYRRLLTAVSLSDLTAFLLLTWILIGPCEELFFRGALQNALTRWGGAAAGILTTGLLFGLAHFDATLWIRSVGAFIVGVLYGLVYHRRRNLIPCMVAHSINDTISFALA